MNDTGYFPESGHSNCFGIGPFLKFYTKLSLKNIVFRLNFLFCFLFLFFFSAYHTVRFSALCCSYMFFEGALSPAFIAKIPPL